ncbi:MAG: serine--tRNA ligase, partial [Chloroflexi bacterium]|nr:serine--tRNA ligase [Chloroflexota bacterium]
MLDLNYIREHTDEVKQAMASLYADVPIDAIVDLDRQRRGALQQVEVLKQQRNTVSKEIGKMKDAAEREAKKIEMRTVGDQIDALDAQVRDVETQLNDLILRVPNMPDASVPVGKDDTENIVTRIEGEPKTAKDFG